MARPGKILGFTGLTITLIILLALCGFAYFKYFWVFSDGTKTGELNSLTYTGYVFKTYEGEIILTKTPAAPSSPRISNSPWPIRKSLKNSPA